MDSTYVFIALAAFFGLLVLATALFWVRRTQLRRTLGTFDASICFPPGGWRMGVCRYTDTHLEWLRLFSLQPASAVPVPAQLPGAEGVAQPLRLNAPVFSPERW